MRYLNSFFLAAALAIMVIATSCSEYSKDPGSVYMPDMAYSRAYEFYSNNPNFKNGITAQQPVAGTVARGAMLPDHIGEFDTIAAKGNKYASSFTMTEIEEGGRIYNIQCAVCHGNNLDGNGPLYNGGNGKYPAAPANFKDAKYLNMPVGTMHHAIMYGKNLMGSYASQLDAKQRWMVLAYIKKIQSENGGAPLNSYFTVNDNGAAPAATPKVDAPKAEAGKEASKETAKAETKVETKMETKATEKVETKVVEKKTETTTKVETKVEEKKDAKTQKK